MCVAATARRRRRQERLTKRSRRFFATRHRATVAPATPKKPAGKK